MVKKYIVSLSAEEKALLESMLKSGTERVRKMAHVRILLRANDGWADEDIQDALDVSIPTIQRVRYRFVEQCFEAALHPSPTRRKYETLVGWSSRGLSGCPGCGAPPAGHRSWSLRLLAQEMVRLEYADELSYETVHRVMGENVLKPWLRKEWCIPPGSQAEFVYYMEDVLDVYQRPADPKLPLICFDETPVQLVSEKRQPIPMKSGQPERYDYEYRREGTSNLFMFFAPLQNWRHVKVTERRTKVDWAMCMHDLVHVHFPEADRCVIVEDQLNTHAPSSLYEVFEPAKAKQILDRLEFHFTPKHGSWLNMAEIELSVLARNAWMAAFPTKRFWLTKLKLGKPNAIQTAQPLTGVSQPPTLASSLKKLYPSIHV